ncbi:MAG: sugar phosphate isomerase/epimerase [Phycisphaerales bacterium]|nr:sugar phosphate isomerase/epimerase [Phycisphaerales bacterium]
MNKTVGQTEHRQHYPGPGPQGVDRRSAIRAGAIGLAAVSVVGTWPAARAAVWMTDPPAPLFTISLAQWSLHRMLESGGLDHLDFPRTAKKDFGIDAVEYVNSFFKENARKEYIAELRKRCDDLGVTSVLIMCDGEGALGDPVEVKRARAVENHHKWVEVAKALGCHSIRVNAQSEGTFEEQQKLAADGLHRLCEFADPHNINVIVENHGGLSSHGDWLAGVMKLTGHPRVGTLPDFGNFYEYDRYKGIEEMMPYAKGVSAKSHDFDTAGNETRTDYRRMLKIVLAAGYHGRIGIEYEGDAVPETDGIRATKALLERVRAEIAGS